MSSTNTRDGGEEGGEKAKTPLPKKSVFSAVTAVYVATFSQLVIFPFLPFMVHDFYPSLHESEIGYYAGFLASAYGVGDFCGSLIWARASDRHGRRPILMAGVMGTVVSVVLFGFSWSYPWAICTRLVWGFLCAIVGVVKTYIAEKCDDSNQAQGFALIGMVAGLGRLTGPSVGGILSNPGDKYGAFENATLFIQFPYLLPCLVASVMALIAVILMYFFLTESKAFSLPAAGSGGVRSIEKGKNKGKRRPRTKGPKYSAYEQVGDDDDVTDDDDDDESGSAVPLTSFHRKTGGHGPKDRQDRAVEMTNRNTWGSHGRDSGKGTANGNADHASISSGSTDSLQSLISDGEGETSTIDLEAGDVSNVEDDDRYVNRDQQEDFESPGSEPVPEPTSLRLIDLLKERDIQTSTALYGLLACVGTVTNELFSLWVLNDLKHGGFSFQSHEIGIALAATAPFQLTWQVYVYPKIVDRLGARRTFRACIAVFAGSCFILPVTVLVRAVGASRTVQWIVLGTVLTVHVTSRVTTFTTVFVLISNSCVPAARARVNSIGQMMAAFTRTLGPALGAITFAWSENNGLPFPFDYHLVWFACGAWVIGMILFSFRLPMTIDFKKDQAPMTRERNLR